MIVTRRRGCGASPGYWTVRLKSTSVSTRTPTAYGRCGRGRAAGAAAVLVDGVVAGALVEVLEGALVDAEGVVFDPPHPATAQTHATANRPRRTRPRSAQVDGEEVPIVGGEVAERRAVHRREQVGRIPGTRIAVADEARPVGVDVELHRADGASMNHCRGERAETLVRARHIDQVPAAVDADRRAPHQRGVAERRSPLG